MVLSRAQTIEGLAAFWASIADEYDLSGSRVRPGVKGGRSRPGAAFDWYISYKDAKGQNLGLAAFHASLVEPMTFEVSLRDTSVRPARVINCVEYEERNFSAAQKDFVAQLVGLGGVRRRENQ